MCAQSNFCFGFVPSNTSWDKDCVLLWVILWDKILFTNFYHACLLIFLALSLINFRDGDYFALILSQCGLNMFPDFISHIFFSSSSSNEASFLS